MSDHVIIAGTPLPREPAVAAASNHNRLGLPDGGRWSKTGSELQRSGHVSSGNWG